VQRDFGIAALQLTVDSYNRAVVECVADDAAAGFETRRGF
jgi:hypothetical protein